jgi:tRNA pseudouridine(38-40) synthase
MFAPIFSDENQSLDLPPPSVHHRKTSFALKVAYRGDGFCGWQTQPNNVKLPSVQQSLEEHLALLDCSRVDVRVSGRTDAGVSAIGQICRFRTRNHISKDDLMAHFETFPLSASFRCLEVQSVTDDFHPTFGATHRAYVYLVDDTSLSDFEVERLDVMLRHLENKTLDYLGLSYGMVKTSTTECTLRCSRACVVELSSGRRALCIQLVGDRFLRRMVRLLVATALSLSWERADSQALLNLVQQQDRSLSSKAAPPDGLVFVGAEYNYTRIC